MAGVARWEPSGADAKRWGWLARIRPLDWILYVLIGGPMFVVYLLTTVTRRRTKGREIVRSLGTFSAYRPLMKGEIHPRAGRRLRARLREVSPQTAHPVRLVLFRDGVAYGKDEGIVSFENGRLGFEGDATAFSLRPDDVSVLPDAFTETSSIDSYDSEFRYGSLATRRAWSFDLATEPRVRVHFYALPVRGYESVYPSLYRWLFDPPKATGEAIFPPFETRPPGRSSESLGARKNP